MSKLAARQYSVKAIHEDNLNVRNPSILAKLLKDYASIKCKEQKEIIAKQIFDTYNFDGGGLSHVNKRVNHDIINAPSPKD